MNEPTESKLDKISQIGPQNFELGTKLFLAPMDGITDWMMRDLLTQVGGIDYCVTEFLRVTQTLHPKKVFIRKCPELLNQGRTFAGVPVFLQLLGGNPQLMAENAFRATELGSLGIDLNYGCPAKVVNRHDGGAVLLKNPNRLYDITRAVRLSVPKPTPVSGKIRLGFEDPNLCIENAKALEEAGSSWITVHCRTKTQGYRPPAHWEWIPKIRENVKIPVIANGDITCLESFTRCQEISETPNYMIGRAALSNPFVFNKLKLRDNFNLTPLQEWIAIKVLIFNFFETCEDRVNIHFATARTKQWLKYLTLSFDEAKILFNQVKVYSNPIVFKTELKKVLLA